VLSSVSVESFKSRVVSAGVWFPPALDPQCSSRRVEVLIGV